MKYSGEDRADFAGLHLAGAIRFRAQFPDPPPERLHEGVLIRTAVATQPVGKRGGSFWMQTEVDRGYHCLVLCTVTLPCSMGMFAKMPSTDWRHGNGGPDGGLKNVSEIRSGGLFLPWPLSIT